MAVEKERVAVIGGGGFIGAHMVSYLKDKGHFVRAVSKSFSSTERSPLYSKADEVFRADISDPTTALNSTKDIEWVMQFSADMGGVGYFSAHDYYPFINNMKADINILESCQANGVGRLFYASSACVYPTNLQMDADNIQVLSENMILPANSDQMYGWEKLMGLMLCERASFDARVGILNTIFGPFCDSFSERAKFPAMIAQKALNLAQNGTPIEVWGNGSQIRSFLYIDDALEMIYKVMTEDYAGPVNISSDHHISVLEIVKLCCQILGVEPNYFLNEDKPAGVFYRYVDNSNFKNRYGYTERFNTREGFTKLIDWMKTK